MSDKKGVTPTRVTANGLIKRVYISKDSLSDKIEYYRLNEDGRAAIDEADKVAE